MNIKRFFIITALIPLFVNCQFSWKAKYLDSVILEAPNSIYSYIASQSNLDSLKSVYDGITTVLVDFDINNNCIDSAEEATYIFNTFGYLISYQRSETSMIAKLLNGLELNAFDFGEENITAPFGDFRIELKKLWAMQAREYGK
ncbi:MAG: hypothetical protein FWD66_03665 [Paludibacter sp.]|nr:hypothetical protein [Paludibacter sp.]